MQQPGGNSISQQNTKAEARSSRLARPPLISRSAELDQLTTQLGRAASGQGCALFLAGEAGIGKTRLAHEALIYARDKGFLVLEGSSYALEDRLAYAPILAAFGPFLRRLEPPHLAKLVSGLPDLGQLFTDLRLPAPSPLGDPALEKTRLFESVARLLDRLARETPVLLFLDDLHWADPASIELLHYLSRGIADQSMFILGTYRAEEIDTARGLRSLVMSLRRSGQASELVLVRLEPDAVAELASSMLGNVAPVELLALLNARAGGTPLFIEALIRSLLDAHQLRKLGENWILGKEPKTVLPPDIRDLILGRLQYLDMTERRVLDLIAVGGGNVSHPVLHTAGEWPDEVLLRAIQRLTINGLVAENVDNAEVTYILTHPLIQEVVYAELPEMARRRSHAALALALERVKPDDLDRLARHYQAAGPLVDLNRTLDVLLAAGERAYALYANDQAARHFGAALPLIREGRNTELLPSVLERLGEAWELVGETAAAITVWNEVSFMYERALNVSALARLQRRLALAEWDRGNFDIAMAHLKYGLQSLAESETSTELAELLHVQVILLRRHGDFDGMNAAAQNLATLAERLGSRRVLAEALLDETASLDVVANRELVQRALIEAEVAGEPLLIQRAHDMQALVDYNLGMHHAAHQHAMLSLGVARQLGAPTLEVYPRNRLVSVDLMAGKWDEAVRESAEVVALARRLGFARGIAGALGMRALVHVYRGDLNEAAACMTEAHNVFGSGTMPDHNIFSQVAIPEMMLALERADKESVLVAAERLERMLTATDFPLQGLALLGEAQVMIGEHERALILAEELMAHVSPPDNGFAIALGSRMQGLAQQSLSRSTQAIASLDDAFRAFTRVEMPFDAARARLEWATLVAASDTDLAVAAVQESLEVFERLGARRYVRRARSMLYKLGARPRSTAPRSRDAIPLSDREREIVLLLAEDLTNNEIAERLVISPRTVTTHLDRIYTRLGINSRTALVRYAIEAGLLPSEH